MSFNLIDAAKGLVTNELVGKASSYLGESEGGVSKALSGILPVILSGFADKSSTHEGATAIANAAKEANNSSFPASLSGFFGGDNSSLLNKGAGLLSGLFGDNKSSLITSLISNFSGIKSSSASSLLSLAVPAVLGLLGKHAAENNLNTSGIASLLSSQKSNFASALPSGLNLGGIFSNAHNKVENIARSATHYADQKPDKLSGGLKILLPVLLLALLAGAIFYFTKDGCNKKTGDVNSTDTISVNTNSVIPATTTTVLGKIDTLSGDFIYDLGENVEIELPNNVGKLTVGKNSTEYKLVQFLNDKTALIDTVKGNWFEFTNVRFKTGGSELTETSTDQLKNLVAIAKAYPAAQFKIGGYTDNSGDKEKNLVLSQKRADVVAAKVKALGAPASSVISAVGYGVEWPIASNETAEGRAQNRRVAVNVKAK